MQRVDISCYYIRRYAKLASTTRHPVWHEKPKHVLHFLSSLYRPDDDPDKGRNIVAKAKYIHIYILGKELLDVHYTHTSSDTDISSMHNGMDPNDSNIKADSRRKEQI
jgi:hypothetical protein